VKHVIKTSGKIEDFSITKLQKSVQASLHAVHSADDATEEVIQKVVEWLKNKHEVSSLDIRTFVAKELAKYNKDAAVLYKNHRDMW
jgi:transcriptional regulator NrdR family protein